MSYEDDQSQLRKEQGLEEEEEIRIEVPKGLPEVNPEIFRDVEPLLFKGFVYKAATINNVPFVFKSLNHHEFEYLSLMGGLQGGSQKDVERNFDYFLALGVLMMDGINVLGDRWNWLPQIATIFRGLTEKPRRKLIFELSEINRRANRAAILSEAYAIEPQSRLRWAQYQGLELVSSAVTGIVGTESLGLNWGQLTWRAINYFEDRKEASEREWENVKFIGAASSGSKAMAKIYSQDRRRRQTEREELLSRRDKIIRLALFNEDPRKSSTGLGQVTAARTVEELATQLKNDLTGEKDWHDMVVDQYEQRVRTAHQQRLQDQQARQLAHQAEYGNLGVIEGSRDLQGLTAEEVRFRLERRQQLLAQRLATQQAHPALHDPKTAHFIDKWVSPDASAPVPVERLKGLPFRREDE